MVWRISAVSVEADRVYVLTEARGMSIKLPIEGLRAVRLPKAKETNDL